MDAIETKIMSLLADSPKTTPEIAAALGRELQYAYAKCESLRKYRFVTKRTVPGFVVGSRAANVTLWSRIA